MRLIAEKTRTISEGAGALALAAALTGQAGEGPIVCVVSGGNIDLAKFCRTRQLISGPRTSPAAFRGMRPRLRDNPG